jgi:hypothetical protein
VGILRPQWKLACERGESNRVSWGYEDHNGHWLEREGRGARNSGDTKTIVDTGLREGRGNGSSGYIKTIVDNGLQERGEELVIVGISIT